MSPPQNLEEEFTKILSSMGLSGWRVLYAPRDDAPERGRVLWNDKIILISDLDRDKALETLVHEYLEIKLRAIVRPWRITLNAVLTGMEKLYYEEKETAINDLVPATLKMIKDKMEKT